MKSNSFMGVSLPLIRRFSVQMLNTLRYLKRHSIVHCDLKPENILLCQPGRSAVKVIDFGSSCFETQPVYTYIQSRFYRSPEVILDLPYFCAIDMWSFGCILAELYTGYPLFPGENEVEQLACMMEVMGLPPAHLITDCSRRKQFFDSEGAPRIVANSKGKKRRPASKDLMSSLRCTDVTFISFLEGCLEWDASERLTPEAALRHEWILELSQQGGGAPVLSGRGGGGSVQQSDGRPGTSTNPHGSVGGGGSQSARVSGGRAGGGGGGGSAGGSMAPRAAAASHRGGEGVSRRSNEGALSARAAVGYGGEQGGRLQPLHVNR